MSVQSFSQWVSILKSPFMANAFLAGVLIAVAAGAMGYLTITRRSAFTAHALAHIGLPGATGAVLLGLPATWGMGVFALGGALAIGALGRRVSQREVATGTVLAFATGLGLFFARMSSNATRQLQSILFGSILTVTRGQIVGFALFDLVLLAVLTIVYRPLLFSSLNEQVARARGVPVHAMGLVYMALMAGVITVATPAVGTLLVFALVVTPAATAIMVTRSPFSAMVVSGIMCLVYIWGGLLVAAALPVPPSFAIVTLSTAVWLVCRLTAGRAHQ